MDEGQWKVASETWQAYNAMETTKQRHFDLLTAVETKKKNFNLDPTEKESQLLKNLLRDHDMQVSAFKSASDNLKQHDPDAHTALFAYIGEINTVLHDIRVTESH
ncbi:MAG: hypothetical protein OER96_02920 [Gammaproteobacteria bacterium]|nr:hypothetical protein [Gammaproteobacteria bacterium]